MTHTSKNIRGKDPDFHNEQIQPEGSARVGVNPLRPGVTKQLTPSLERSKSDLLLRHKAHRTAQSAVHRETRGEKRHGNVAETQAASVKREGAAFGRSRWKERPVRGSED